MNKRRPTPLLGRRGAVGGLLAAALIGTGTGPAAARRPDAVARARIRRLVAREALNMGVEVALALAVAHAESNFDPEALSVRGARGVMQIMPLTARAEYGIDPRRLWDPRLNVRLGLHFLRRLIVRYRGRVDLALSHYNGGSAAGRRNRVIPATRPYVAKVRRLAARYRRRANPINRPLT